VDEIRGPGLREEALDIAEYFFGTQMQISIPRIFIEFMGDIKSAAFLNQLLYWSKVKGRNKWFFKSYSEWYEEVFLNEKAIRRISNHLKRLGILETKVQKAYGNPTVHYKIDRKAFDDRFRSFCLERSRRNDRNEEGVLTETYTITEITNRDYNKDLCPNIPTELSVDTSQVAESKDLGETNRLGHSAGSQASSVGGTPPSKKKAQLGGVNDKGLAEIWDECWKLYPRKVTKKEARSAFVARVNQGASSDELLQATRNYEEDCRVNERSMNYIMLPKTFYGPNERYRDYLTDSQAEADFTPPNPLSESQENNLKRKKETTLKQLGLA
jgi:hypothetical protein